VRTLGTERGQTAVEYIGMLLVVAAAMAVVLSSGIGDAVTAKVEQAICAIATDDGLDDCAGGAPTTASGDGAGPRTPPTEGEGQGIDAVAAERAASPAAQSAAVVPASASGGAEPCFASTGGCEAGPQGAIVEPPPDVAPEAEEEGGLDEAVLGPPEGNWIVRDGQLRQQFENGIGGGAIRALGRAVVGLGAKALNAAKARAARLGTRGVSAEGLLASERTARTQAAGLQKLLPAVTRDRATMAVGVGRDKATGALRVVVGSSERGALRPAVREAVRSSGAMTARTPGRAHAEQRVLNYMRANGLEAVTVGAGRPICSQCAAAIAKEGATAASRLKPPPRASISRSRTE